MVDTLRLGSSLTRTLFTDDDFDIDFDDVTDENMQTIDNNRLRPLMSSPSGEPVDDTNNQ
jgi:hypothetical protein